MLLKIELLKGQSNMDNPEKLAKYGTQDEDKQNTICDTHHYAQINERAVVVVII
jgi:hypothetical protein